MGYQGSTFSGDDGVRHIHILSKTGENPVEQGYAHCAKDGSCPAEPGWKWEVGPSHLWRMDQVDDDTHPESQSEQLQQDHDGFAFLFS